MICEKCNKKITRDTGSVKFSDVIDIILDDKGNIKSSKHKQHIQCYYCYFTKPKVDKK